MATLEFPSHTTVVTDQPNEFKLGDWHVTPLRGIIHGRDGSRRLTPKAMDVLLCMARRPGEVIDRETFQREVWHGRAFSDDPLNKCIAELRRQLGDTGGSRAYIETIPKRGYRLVAAVVPLGTATAAEDRKDQPLRYLRLAALLVLCGFAAVGVMRLSNDVVPNDDIAVAVLPFTSVGETEKQYFADGVHEELIGALSQNHALSVRPRASTLMFRERSRSLVDIANELGVNVIVDGSVRQEGDTVRVAAQLVSTDDNENLWAGSIERSLSVASLFSIQHEIAREIAGALNVTLLDNPPPRDAELPTDSIEAYDAFMLGKFHYRRQLPGDIRESVVRFERAVALDPTFADAWDWLAYAYNHAATNVGYLAPREAYPKARAAALRALEIEPDLATAQSILGYIRAVYDRDWVGAVADLERALELDASDSGTVWSLAHVYALLGRHDEAIALVVGLAERYPESGRNHLEVVNRLIDAGRFEEALERLAVAEAHDAEPAMISDTRGIALVGLGRLADAEESLEFAVDAKKRDASTVGRLAHVYGRLGKRSQAEALLSELEERAARERITRLVFATVHAGLDDGAAAIAELRTAMDAGDREAIGITTDPFFAELRAHPDFQALMAELRIPNR